MLISGAFQEKLHPLKDPFATGPRASSGLLLSRLGRVAAMVRSSLQRRDTYKIACVTKGTDQNLLTLDVSIRWNSTYDLLKRVLEEREVLAAMLRHLRLEGHESSDEDSAKVASVVTALHPFDVATSVSFCVQVCHLVARPQRFPWDRQSRVQAKGREGGPGSSAVLQRYADQAGRVQRQHIVQDVVILGNDAGSDVLVPQKSHWQLGSRRLGGTGLIETEVGIHQLYSVYNSETTNDATATTTATIATATDNTGHGTPTSTPQPQQERRSGGFRGTPRPPRRHTGRT
ncbi:hypothetical protein K470DRAFT_271799 [Piedraia hortae CBS 480.64]|uniref:Uncharacterized protein n=1 Tax=Piedraia hortae CBS 480.64 TaxID=1314780 RepID=A0A6A7BVR6_9PEZI|nr:hypothetical protein K470DRAFT_271799 [Piedraia hortae CBS 480.64]